ncbi:hypothetical protein K435DRAFT_721362 [Dendrothele bispora CBS 962.96]|uniref:polynucleotide adenylyltransferase n=1 Tax=Dendrothele bispora (strain CBS 962.96) TaxID=1314807 RepID=A0A4S8M6Y7_DENBC|nr:hypothetical protein K435DRAFT_721362 [Dendrothele bispora CBS 962.96]
MSYSPQPIHHPHRLRHLSKQRFIADLSQCLFDFVIQLLPTPDEMSVKEDVRKLLERLIRTIEPDSRLLSFGSTANGFSLRNSDMDLCCLIDSEERLAASDLVTMLGDLLERETKFHVKPLPHARIPIVKLSLDPSPGLPLGIACDIGFENRLALENTRLLMCYAMIDPTRVRTLVLFLKVWSKRRKINSPYKGTLSSYGYVLLVIYFLVHVKNPPVLPNLQQMPPLRPIPKEETHLAGHNTWFFDDIDLLRQRWHSENTESVAELLIDFFRYFSRDFPYNVGVASIRAGLLKKDSKGWQNDLSAGRYNDARERNRICIEDPFETDFNVARCVTKDGLYTIRGEFMRASRILAARPERAILALADLCDERQDEELISAPPNANPNNHNGNVNVNVGALRQQVPPQTPYSVGSRPLRSNNKVPQVPQISQVLPTMTVSNTVPVVRTHEGAATAGSVVQHHHSVSQTQTPPPAHMAPRRSKWTSPPPPEASPADHTLYENQLGAGLELATAATDAREQGESSSESNSEILDPDFEEDVDERSDVADSDDVRSVRSYTEGAPPSSMEKEGSSFSAGPMFRSPSWLVQGGSGGTGGAGGLIHHAHMIAARSVRGEMDLGNGNGDETPSIPVPGKFGGPGVPTRGRFNFQTVDSSSSSLRGATTTTPTPTKRSSSGPSSASSRSVKTNGSPAAVSVPLPPSPEPATVFYQTPPTQTRSPRTAFVYPPSISSLHSQSSQSQSGSPSISPRSPLSPSALSTQQVQLPPQYHTHATHQTQQSPQSQYHTAHTHHHQQQYYNNYMIPHDIFPSSLPPLFASTSTSASDSNDAGSGTPTPIPLTTHLHHRHPHHSHTGSNATIVPAHPSPSRTSYFEQGNGSSPRSRSSSRSRSKTRSKSRSRSKSPSLHSDSRSALPRSSPIATSCPSNDHSSSPTPSSSTTTSASTSYTTSDLLSRSPSSSSLSLSVSGSGSPRSKPSFIDLKKGGRDDKSATSFEEGDTPRAGEKDRRMVERVALVQAPNSEAAIEIGISGRGVGVGVGEGL